MTLQLPGLFQARADLDALLKEKNNVTGDLLPRMVLDLNVKLAKVAELAGMWSWHKTSKPNTEASHSCPDEEADTLWCGICHESYDPHGEFEKHEDILGRFHSLCPDPECSKNILMGFRRRNPIMEAYSEVWGTALSIATLIEDEEERGQLFEESLKPLGPKFRSSDVAGQMFRIQKEALEITAVTEFGYELKQLYRHLLYLGELLNLDPDQITTAYMESIERQRQAAGV